MRPVLSSKFTVSIELHPRASGGCPSLLQPEKEKELNGLAEVMRDLKTLLETMWTHGYVPPSLDQGSSPRLGKKTRHSYKEPGSAKLQARVDGNGLTRNPPTSTKISADLKSDAQASHQGLSYLHGHLYFTVLYIYSLLDVFIQSISP